MAVDLAEPVWYTGLNDDHRSLLDHLFNSAFNAGPFQVPLVRSFPRGAQSTTGDERRTAIKDVINLDTPFVPYRHIQFGPATNGHAKTLTFRKLRKRVRIAGLV